MFVNFRIYSNVNQHLKTVLNISDKYYFAINKIIIKNYVQIKIFKKQMFKQIYLFFHLKLIKKNITAKRTTWIIMRQ